MRGAWERKKDPAADGATRGRAVMKGVSGKQWGEEGLRWVMEQRGEDSRGKGTMRG